MRRRFQVRGAKVESVLKAMRADQWRFDDGVFRMTARRLGFGRGAKREKLPVGFDQELRRRLQASGSLATQKTVLKSMRADGWRFRHAPANAAIQRLRWQDVDNRLHGGERFSDVAAATGVQYDRVVRRGATLNIRIHKREAALRKDAEGLRGCQKT
eukprot:10222013-Karenia_brevis.AAC.1